MLIVKDYIILFGVPAILSGPCSLRRCSKYATLSMYIKLGLVTSQIKGAVVVEMMRMSACTPGGGCQHRGQQAESLSVSGLVSLLRIQPGGRTHGGKRQ